MVATSGERDRTRREESGDQAETDPFDFLIHPGIVLKEEFMEGVSQVELSRVTGLSKSRINAILNGKRRINAEAAIAFAKYFSPSAEFFSNLQMQYDLRKSRYLQEKNAGPRDDVFAPTADLPPIRERLVVGTGRRGRKVRL